PGRRRWSPARPPPASISCSIWRWAWLSPPGSWASSVDILTGLLQGFSVALAPTNLLWCFVGVFLGTVVGVLPGLGPPATIAMLLPLTFSMNPAGAIIMLAGIYYGAKYGGSTTSILMN